MTDVELVNRWTEKAVKGRELEVRRADLKIVLEGRFPGQTSAEVLQTIDQQPSAAMLQDWLHAALQAASMENFIKVLRQ